MRNKAAIIPLVAMPFMGRFVAIVMVVTEDTATLVIGGGA